MQANRTLSSSFGSKLTFKRTPLIPMASVPARADKDHSFKIPAAPPPAISKKLSKLTGSTSSGGAAGPHNIPDKLQQHFPKNFFEESQAKELAQEESHLFQVVHRVMEFDDHDRDTIHSLIFLLMQYLSRPDQTQSSDEKGMARNQVRGPLRYQT